MSHFAERYFEYAPMFVFSAIRALGSALPTLSTQPQPSAGALMPRAAGNLQETDQSFKLKVGKDFETFLAGAVKSKNGAAQLGTDASPMTLKSQTPETSGDAAETPDGNATVSDSVSSMPGTVPGIEQARPAFFQEPPVPPASNGLVLSALTANTDVVAGLQQSVAAIAANGQPLATQEDRRQIAGDPSSKAVAGASQLAGRPVARPSHQRANLPKQSLGANFKADTFPPNFVPSNAGGNQNGTKDTGFGANSDEGISRSPLEKPTANLADTNIAKNGSDQPAVGQGAGSEAGSDGLPSAALASTAGGNGLGHHTEDGEDSVPTYAIRQTPLVAIRSASPFHSSLVDKSPKTEADEPQSRDDKELPTGPLTGTIQSPPTPMAALPVKVTERPSATLDLAAPDATEAIGDAMALGSATLKQDGQTALQLQLDPPGLGAVRVNLTGTNQAVNARVVVQTESTRQLVESQVSLLRDRLMESSGVTLGKFEVTWDNRGSGGQWQQAPQEETPPPARSPSNGRSSTLSVSSPVPDSRGSIDVVA
jgi:hypothetical protein